MTVSTVRVTPADTLARVTLYVLAALTAVNGIAMLADGATWFAQTPGVAATGPFNPHLVADVGGAYVGAAIAYLLAARQPAWRLPLLMATLGFMGIHGLAHVLGWIRNGCSTGLAFWTELVGVMLPAALTLLLLIAGARERA